MFAAGWVGSFDARDHREAEVSRRGTAAAGGAWAWYKSARNRWAVTQRNAVAALIRDANAELVLGADDDAELDTFAELSTERLLRDATGADCWVIRDPLSAVFDDRAVLSRFKAYRDGCVFWEQGKRHPSADTWELWEMGPSVRIGSWQTS